MLLAASRKRTNPEQNNETEPLAKVKRIQQSNHGKEQPRNDNWKKGETFKSRLLPIGGGNWLGTHRHLQAAFAAIDDRLLFFRLCEELDARGIRYEPVSTERTVGGHMLRLIDISSMSSRHGVECADFFQNLFQCNIRLAQTLQDRSYLECSFINHPLVPDFNRTEEEVEADMNRPLTWVQQVGTSPSQSHVRARAKMLFDQADPPNSPQMSQVIAQNIEERLLTYCHVYVPVKQFASSYFAHFRHFCNIRTFAYFKLSLAYGDQRDLLLVLAWRRHGAYSLCFGQSPRPGTAGNGSIKNRWNSHVLVCQQLTERFNREKNLVWLINYLVNTHRSIDAIYNFMRTQMRSTKIESQLLGTEVAFPVELLSNLTVLDEHTIRLSYGPRIAMEFLLLGDNKVAFRDCSVGYSRTSAGGGPSLADFWHFWSQKKAEMGKSI